MMIRCLGKTVRAVAWLVLMPGVFATGCGPSGVPQPRVIRVNVLPPLEVVRAQLERYVEGQPVDSERDLFSAWVNDVRATDPETADWLGNGLAEIESKPAQVRVLAKKMLERLPRADRGLSKGENFPETDVRPALTGAADG